jgi:peptidyl-tRNA hydrolase, PTH1 family
MSQFADEKEQLLALAGLGNPGKHYENTRHNAGFQVLDRLARRYLIPLRERRYHAAWGMGRVERQRVLLCKPLTFMNRSGEALREVMHAFKISAGRLLLIHDDLDLPCGRIKLVERGGAGGHRGVSSIIDRLGHQDFPRIKLGIGRPLRGEPIESYVLQAPYPEERVLFEEMLELGEDAAHDVMVHGLMFAMNRFNCKEPGVESSTQRPL